MSEFMIRENSLLVGKRLADIVNEYSVKILHYHNPKIDLQTKIPYNPDTIIKSYFLLKASGSDKSIRKLRLDSVKYN